MVARVDAIPRSDGGGDSLNIVPATHEAIEQAGEALRAGQLVVIPTETVYGLAADATNAEAVRAVFTAKQRPADNPLIVHIADWGQLGDVAAKIPPVALELMEHFWPGPLTVVLPKLKWIPEEVTAGLDSVAVRMPTHPVAREVIRAAGRPLAAPSANRFMQLSPTRADHVDPNIGDFAAMVLDGGPCEVGLESTVVDFSGDRPKLLRPGVISRQSMELVMGSELDTAVSDEPKKGPGMYRRHYAPRTPVRLVSKLGPEDVGIVLGNATGPGQISLGDDADAYSAHLYETLYDLDRKGVAEILVEIPPQTPEWEAVQDRLRKASHSGPED